MKISPKYAARFYEKLLPPNANGCLEWSGYRLPKGYGIYRFLLNGKYVPRLAHRVAWALKNGPIPAGMIVMHKCDNPACSNHEHLMLGSCKDNTQDMVKKGRHFWATQLPWTKLSDEDVARVFELKRSGTKQYKIAESLKVSPALISLIVNRRLRSAAIGR